MIRDLVTSGLAVPLIVVALLAALLGYFVTQRIATPRPQAAVRVSVVGLPRAATPSPSPTPEVTTAPSDETGSDETGGAGGGSDGQSDCPAGCRCSGHPGGIVIVCH